MSDAAALAMDLIRQHGAMRTPQLAEKLEIGEGAVDAMLEPARLSGKLITCAVETGGRRVMEYRCSVNGGKYSPHTGFASLRLKDHSSTRGASAVSTERADQAPLGQRSPLPSNHQETTSMSVRDQIEAALKEHGPLDTRGMRKHVKAAHLSTVVAQLARMKILRKLGGGARSSIYGLPGQELKDGLASGGELGRKPRAAKKRKHPAARKRAGGGSAAMRRKRAVKAARRRPFEVAITSGGALLFLNAKRGDLDLSKSELQGFLKACRHLNEDEIATALDFITRLDGAEVGA